MDKIQVEKELVFKAVRSSGAGGQHVNKVSTNVILIFDVANSKALSDEEKELLLSKLAKRLNRKQELIVRAADSRSQSKNREIATKKLLNILEEGLKKQKPRKKTKPSPGSKEKRLKEKRQRSEKKSTRKRPDEF